MTVYSSFEPLEWMLGIQCIDCIVDESFVVMKIGEIFHPVVSLSGWRSFNMFRKSNGPAYLTDPFKLPIV